MLSIKISNIDQAFGLPRQYHLANTSSLFVIADDSHLHNIMTHLQLFFKKACLVNNDTDSKAGFVRRINV